MLWVPQRENCGDLDSTVCGGHVHFLSGAMPGSSCRHGQVTSSPLWGSSQGFADVVFLVHYLCVMGSGGQRGSFTVCLFAPFGWFPNLRIDFHNGICCLA